MKYYYVDSCIYLNLWKKEFDFSGNLLWNFAKDFFEKAQSENSVIYYSGFLLKELMFVLDEKEFIGKLELFNYSPGFVRITLTKEEYEEAQKLKDRINSNISLFDIIHALLAKKTNSILVTRDRDLIEFAKNINIEAKKPEELS